MSHRWGNKGGRPGGPGAGKTFGGNNLDRAKRAVLRLNAASAPAPPEAKRGAAGRPQEDAADLDGAAAR